MVKKAYRELVKKYHPDVNHNPQGKERFMAIQEAYEHLMADNYPMVNHATIPPEEGSFDSFRYRTNKHFHQQNTKKQEPPLLVNIRTGLSWFVQGLFLIIGVLMVVLPTRNALLIGPPKGFSPTAYYFGTVMASMVGVVLVTTVILIFKSSHTKFR